MKSLDQLRSSLSGSLSGSAKTFQMSSSRPSSDSISLDLKLTAGKGELIELKVEKEEMEKRHTDESSRAVSLIGEKGISCHIVLVHYRKVKGSKTSFGFPPNAEVASSFRMSSPVSSVTNGNQVASSTDTTSLNSAHTSEKYEDTESESHQTSSTYLSFLELPQSENRPVVSQMNAGLMNSYFSASSPSAQGDFHGTQLSNSGLDFVPLAQEHRNAPFRPSVSSRQPPTMDISQQGNMIFGQPLAYELHNKQEPSDSLPP